MSTLQTRSKAKTILTLRLPGSHLGAISILFAIAIALPLHAQTVVDRISYGIAGGAYGIDIESLGDFNGDSVEDFAVLAAGSVPDGASYGHLQFISGINFSVLHEIRGTETSPLPTANLAVIGDVNADSVTDLALASPTYSDNGRIRGAVVIYSGATRLAIDTIFGTDDDDSFGFSLVALGDINGDSVGDFAVGAPSHSEPFRSNQGYVRVFSGADRSELTTLYGDGASDRFGYALAKIGDLNADSVNEFVVGAPEFGSTQGGKGFVRVFSGSNFTTLFTKAGTLTGSRFGSAVDNAGDVNGDTLSDIVIGAPYYDDKGRGYVISGNSGTDLYEATGKNDGDSLGGVVRGLGDITGDGRADYALVSVAGTFDKAVNGGYIRLFSGIDGSIFKTLRGTVSNGFFGASILAVNDINANGTEDLLVGAPLTSSDAAYDVNPDGVVFFISIKSGPAGGGAQESVGGAKKQRTTNKKRKGQRL